MKKLLLLGLLLLPLPAAAQQYPSHSMLIGAGPGTTGFRILGPCSVNQVPTWVSGPASDPICATPPGTGTVTSVGLTLPASTFNVANSPVTTSGTLTGSFTNQNPNTLLAGPSSGVLGVPSWRALVGADLPNPTTSTLGGIQAIAAVAHQWINSISTSGVPSLTQPAFSDISGIAAGSQLPTPTTSTLGGVFSSIPVTSNWVNSISSSGTPVLSQPTFNDLAGSIGLAQIPALGAYNVIANATNATALPTSVSISALIDAAFGSVQGSVLYRGASGWAALTVGTSGQVLTSGGAAANPAWTSVSGTGTMTSITAGTSVVLTPSTCTSSCSVGLATVAAGNILSNITAGTAAPISNTLSATIDATMGSTQGDVLFRGGSTWTALAPGTAGQVLASGGAAANPKWVGAPTVSVVTTSSHSGGFGANTSGTYTTPAGVTWIEIGMIGGGGGSAGGNNGAAAGNGGASCWNTTGAACTSPVYSANGGSGAAGANAGFGGTSTGCTRSIFGSPGGSGQPVVSGGSSTNGGNGGGSSIGGGGPAGNSGQATSGGGGGGGTAGTAATYSGAGGGGGGGCYVLLTSPAATYTYAVGAGGATSGAGSGGGAGGNGAAGQIYVIEHYGS